MPSWPSTALVAAIAASEAASRTEANAAGPVVRAKHRLAFETHEAATTTGATKKSPVVMLHGWPDDPRLFTPLAERLAARGHRCVNIKLPSYPYPPDWKGTKEELPGGERKWGVVLADVIELVRETVVFALGDNTPATWIVHDWGAIYAYLVQKKYPELFSRLVSIDVGWITQPSMLQTAFVLAYQSLLNVAWSLPPMLGDPLTNVVPTIGNRPPAKNSAAVCNTMNWPYRMAWRDVFSGSSSLLRGLDAHQPLNLPWLHVHGTDSPLPKFHDDAFIARVKASSPHSRVEALPGNHWLLTSHLDAFCSVALPWLDATEAASASGVSTAAGAGASGGAAAAARL